MIRVVTADKHPLFKPAFSGEQEEKLRIIAAWLQEANKKTNLTSICAPEAIWGKHILDCASLALIWRPDFLKAVDLGTGGGFPGLPLAVLYPETRFFLVDSRRKKVEEVRKAVETLGIINAACLAVRGEELARMDEFRERMDLVVSRAVGCLSILVELGVPLLKIGGRLAAMKTPQQAEEIAAAAGAMQELHCCLEKTVGYTLPGEGRRELWLLRKDGPSPEKYPRRPGIPEKRPL
ncbi:MAG: 16S rRNA (guanine(527)-N(7))-methyltransferase RsmG [Bacillota bacterium]